VKAIVIMAVMLASCATLKYQADIGFLNSAQANSMEAIVHIFGKVCKDMNGEVGVCATRVRSDQAIKFKQPALQYSYKLDMVCSSAIDSNESWSVPMDQTFSWEIRPEKFSAERMFVCIGEIFPADRPNKLSATWKVSVTVLDGKYKKRENIHHLDGHLILGAHAKYSVVCDPKCKEYKEKTMVKASPNAIAYSESEVMRYNYYGF